jgi:hypothetical protein
LTGKASVMMALELAISIAPPTPWPIRIRMSQSTPAVPCIQVSASSTENAVKTAKPALYMFTRPYMSPRRPRIGVATEALSRKPVSIQPTVLSDV